MRLGEFVTALLSNRDPNSELDIRGEFGEHLGLVAINTSDDGERTIIDLGYEIPWCPIDLDQLGAANEQRY